MMYRDQLFEPRAPVEGYALIITVAALATAAGLYLGMGL
jgi:hypothetical protein